MKSSGKAIRFQGVLKCAEIKGWSREERLSYMRAQEEKRIRSEKGSAKRGGRSV